MVLIFQADIVIMGIIVIGVVAYLFELFMRWVECKLVPWKGMMVRLKWQP